MATVEELLIKITAENKDLKAKLAESEKSVQKFGGISSKVTSMIASGYAMAGTAIAAFAVSSFKAWEEQEKANKRLMSAVDGNVNKFKELTAQAEQLRSTTAVDDGAIMQIQQLAIGAGHTMGRVKKLTEASVELAAKTGQDLQSAYMQLNGTLSGSAGRLSRVDSEFSTLSEAQLRNGGAIDLVLTKYKGFAADSATATDKLKSSWGEFKEAFGASVSKVIVPSLDAMASRMDKINEKKGFWQKFAMTFAEFGGGISTGAVNAIVVNSTLNAVNLAKEWTPGLLANQAALKAVKEQAEKNDVALQKLLDTQNAINLMEALPDVKTDGQKNAAEEAAKAWEDYMRRVHNAMKEAQKDLTTFGDMFPEDGGEIKGAKSKGIGDQYDFTDKLEAISKFRTEEVNLAKAAADQMAIIDQQAALNKMALLSGMLGQMASIFGENTIAYKAFASAQAVIDTYLAANNALAQLPVPLNFVGAAVSIATGLANVAKINGVALAQGGLAYGPTNALIGEYAGAGSNPEVIAPLDKLKDMMGGGSTRVYGRLYAGDIYLSNKRGARQMERRGAR